MLNLYLVAKKQNIILLHAYFKIWILFCLLTRAYWSQLGNQGCLVYEVGVGLALPALRLVVMLLGHWVREAALPFILLDALEEEGRRGGLPLLPAVDFPGQFLYELPTRLPGGIHGLITKEF